MTLKELAFVTLVSIVAGVPCWYLGFRFGCFDRRQLRELIDWLGEDLESRKEALIVMSGEHPAVSSESTARHELAAQLDSVMTRERVVLSESTVSPERVVVAERTKPSERADWLESTARQERDNPWPAITATVDQ